MTKPLALALVHHPVVDRRGDEVTTAVTNLDLHDIARTAATFGVDRFYAVTVITSYSIHYTKLYEGRRSVAEALCHVFPDQCLGVRRCREVLSDYGFVQHLQS